MKATGAQKDSLMWFSCLVAASRAGRAGATAMWQTYDKIPVNVLRSQPS